MIKKVALSYVLSSNEGKRTKRMPDNIVETTITSFDTHRFDVLAEENVE